MRTKDQIYPRKKDKWPVHLVAVHLRFLLACAIFCQVAEASTVAEEVVDSTVEVGEEG